MPKSKRTITVEPLEIVDVQPDTILVGKQTFEVVLTTETKRISIVSDEPFDNPISAVRYFENHPDGEYEYGPTYVTVETLE